METALGKVIDAARKAENVTGHYATAGKHCAEFLTMWTGEDGHKRADGVKALQTRLGEQGIGTNVTRYVKVHCVVSLAPDAESLPISGVIALAPMVALGVDGPRTAGRYTAKELTALVKDATEKRWTAKVIAAKVKAIREGSLTPEQERQRKVKAREARLEKVRAILEKIRPDDLAKVIAASSKAQGKLATALATVQTPESKAS